MKAYRLFAVTLALFIFPLSSSFAQSGLTIEAVVVRNANLRAGPGETYDIIGLAKVGQLVTVTDYEADWYQLSTGEWIAMFLVEPTPDSRVVAFRLEDVPATANRVANLRDGPGTDYAIVGRVQAGQRLQVVAQNGAGDWLKLSNDLWIATFLVNRVATGLPVIDNDSSAVITTKPTIQPTATPVPFTATPVSSAPTEVQQSCDPSYPDFCIAPGIADLDCGDITYQNFRVVGADPHGFDGNDDGVGCENN